MCVRVLFPGVYVLFLFRRQSTNQPKSCDLAFADTGTSATLGVLRRAKISRGPITRVWLYRFGAALVLVMWLC